jgi:hypothetical protein
MAVVIVLTMGLSSFAVAIFYLGGQQQPQKQFKQLTNFVVDGELDPNAEYEYYNNGYTIIKFYYNITLQDISSYVDQLPDLFKTTDNKNQIIVEKITYNETYIKIMSLNGEDTIYNITEEEIQKSLCNIILSAPLECVIANMNLTETNNTSNNTNSSY